MMAPFLFARDLLLVAIFMSFASKELLGVVLPPEEGYPSLSNAAIQKEFDEKKGFKDYIAKKLDTFGVTSEPTTTRLTTSDKTQTIPRRTTPPPLLKTLEPRTMEPNTMGPETMKPKTMAPTTMAPTVVATSLSPDALDECNKICPKIVETPKCGSLRMAPQYEEKCHCLIRYVCCNETCPSVDKSICKGGESFPEMTTDCCDCPAIRCDACPSYKTPSCNFECEKIHYQVLDNGCSIPKCTQSCPAPVNPVCPSCQMSEAYVNGSLCGCELQRCVPKPCPKKVTLPKKNCYDRTWKHDDCGCDVHRYVRSTYCTTFNKQAQKNKCTDSRLPTHCFENVVREGKSVCGCDVGECVLLDEKVSNKFGTKVCPNGYFLEEGLTTCGKDRDVCLPCPSTKYTNDTCDPDCNDIVTRTDANKCTFQECVEKACFDKENCIVWKDVGIREKCGCNCFKGPQVDVVNREMWLVVQRRNHVGHWCSTVNNFCYNTPWANYRNGFGDVSSTSYDVDYWRGLEEMYQLTKTGKWQLMMKMKYTSGSKDQQDGFAIWNDFKIDSEANQYTLRLGSMIKYDNLYATYDPLAFSKNRKFSTYDRTNGAGMSCQTRNKNGQSGGWWMGNCWRINFNSYFGYQLWYDGGSYRQVWKTEMGIRPVV